MLTAWREPSLLWGSDGHHQPARMKNEGPTTTTSSNCHMVFATQPVELLEEIDGLEGTDFAPGTWRTIGGQQESTYVQSKQHAERTTEEDLHRTPPSPRRQRGD